MIKEIFKRIYLINCFLVLIFSCVEDIDFNQAKDIIIKPVIESSLIFFEEPATRFLDNGNEINEIKDFVFIDFFNDEFFVDNLVKAEFKFEIINSINREFELQIDLFDGNQLQHTFNIVAEASPNNSDIFSSNIETFEDNTLEALKKTTVLVFTLRVLPGSTFNENTLGRIQLKSIAAFYFKIGDTL